jgi:phosphatidylinositol glycan class Q protein
MHPLSVLSLGIFVAGYITARWDLVTRLYELAIFAWDHGVVVSRRATPLPPSVVPGIDPPSTSSRATVPPSLQPARTTKLPCPLCPADIVVPLL